MSLLTPEADWPLRLERGIRTSLQNWPRLATHAKLPAKKDYIEINKTD